MMISGQADETRGLEAREGLVWQTVSHVLGPPYMPHWRLGGRLCETTLSYSDTSSPTSLQHVMAISHHNHLIVAGGRDSNGWDTNVVEVYDGRQWMRTDPLPKHCSHMKTTFHNGNYYLMGGGNQDQSVFCASLQSLIAKATQQSPTSLTHGSMSVRCQWQSNTPAPSHSPLER